MLEYTSGLTNKCTEFYLYVTKIIFENISRFNTECTECTCNQKSFSCNKRL